MTTAQDQEEIARRLLEFIRESFLAGDPERELAVDTPLLELGILNSLNTATLIAQMHEEFGVKVPLHDVTPETFKNVENLSAMVRDRQEHARA